MKTYTIGGNINWCSHYVKLDVTQVKYLYFSMGPSWVFMLHKVSKASLLQSRAFPELFSPVCSCLFIAFAVFVREICVGTSLFVNLLTSLAISFQNNLSFALIEESSIFLFMQNVICLCFYLNIFIHFPFTVIFHFFLQLIFVDFNQLPLQPKFFLINFDVLLSFQITNMYIPFNTVMHIQTYVYTIICNHTNSLNFLTDPELNSIG